MTTCSRVLLLEAMSRVSIPSWLHLMRGRDDWSVAGKRGAHRRSTHGASAENAGGVDIHGSEKGRSDTKQDSMICGGIKLN